MSHNGSTMSLGRLVSAILFSAFLFVNCTSPDNLPGNGVEPVPLEKASEQCEINSDCDRLAVDHCQIGTCQSHLCVFAPKSCVASDACHLAGTCDPTNGVCSNPVAPNGSACDDNNLCSTGDQCQNGSCVAVPVTCQASDQCHNVGVCDVATGICSDPVKANGSVCTDSNGCTMADQCQTGACVPGTPVVCDDLNDCTTDSCNELTGQCVYNNNQNPCDDGDLCTVTDTCNAGACTGNVVVCNDSNDCTDDSCNSATGTCTFTPNVASCDDGDACTVADTCGNGACEGTVKTCNDGNSCTNDACNPATGACVYINNTNSCSDNDLCTQNDVCTNGACKGTGVVCPAQDQCHEAGQCVPATGTCFYDKAPNNLPCQDGDACTVNDVCENGACQSGSVAYEGCCTHDSECGAMGAFWGWDSPCTTDAECANLTDTPTCSRGQCVPTGWKFGCTVDPVFDPELFNAGDKGSCTTCRDLDNDGFCIDHETNCTNGFDDDRDLLIDCEDVKDCDGATCDDANSCTTSDTCLVDGLCHGTAVANGTNCGVNKFCQYGICTLGCTADADCDDGKGCTTDTCLGGTCINNHINNCVECNSVGLCLDMSAAVGCFNQEFVQLVNGCQVHGYCTMIYNSCDDSNPCTVDTCNPATGCSHSNVDCDDGDACTADSCDPTTGECEYSAPLDCDDGDPLTMDYCNPATGACVHACDQIGSTNYADCYLNGVHGWTFRMCTTGYTWSDWSNCLVCDDANQCTIDQINEPQMACEHLSVANGTTCTGGTCQAGQCVLTPQPTTITMIWCWAPEADAHFGSVAMSGGQVPLNYYWDPEVPVSSNCATSEVPTMWLPIVDGYVEGRNSAGQWLGYTFPPVSITIGGKAQVVPAYHPLDGDGAGFHFAIPKP